MALVIAGGGGAGVGASGSTGWDQAASVTALAFRATRIDITGAPLLGANNQIVFGGGGFDRVQSTREYETGNDVTAVSAAGSVCVAYKVPDSIKRSNIQLALCAPHPEVEEMLCGGIDIATQTGTSTTTSAAIAANATTFTTAAALTPGPYVVDTTASNVQETVQVASVNGTTATLAAGTSFRNAHISGVTVVPGASSIGYAAPQTYSLLSQAISLEVWTLAIQNGGPAAVNPYFRWLFPRVYGFRRSGDTVLNNGVTAALYEGYGTGNPGLGGVGTNSGSPTPPLGPTKDWVTAGLPIDRVDAYVRTSTLPTVTNGYATVS